MTGTARKPRTTARRGSYLFGALADGVLLVLINICLARPQRTLTAVGDVVGTTAGLVALTRTLQVFPFTFTESTTDWPPSRVWPSSRSSLW